MFIYNKYIGIYLYLLYIHILLVYLVYLYLDIVKHLLKLILKRKINKRWYTKILLKTYLLI